MPYSPFAAPSWVFPGSAAENACFLANRVKNIALLCFEPSLPDLSELELLNLRWHIHLPTALPVQAKTLLPKTAQNRREQTTGKDLPSGQTLWENAWSCVTPAEYARLCADIFCGCAALHPWGAVLHLPPADENSAELLEGFIEEWERLGLDASLLLPENVKQAPHSAFMAILEQRNMRLCFDVAHHMAFEGLTCPPQELLHRASLLHWSAPGGQDATAKATGAAKSVGAKSAKITSAGAKNVGTDKHLPLTQLSAQEMTFCRTLAEKIPADALHCIEVFDWTGFAISETVLKNILKRV